MDRGYMYLVAIMDWHSRKFLSWRISNTPDSAFCLNALEEARGRFGPPYIFNTDQASQCTSNAVTRFSRTTKCPSARMAEAVARTMFLESGYGGPSSTSTFIYTHLKTAGRFASDLPSGSSATIWQEAILLLTTKPRMRLTLVCLARSPRLPDTSFSFSHLRACGLSHPSGCPINGGPPPSHSFQDNIQPSIPVSYSL